MFDISYCDVIYYFICLHYVRKAISPFFAWASSSIIVIVMKDLFTLINYYVFCIHVYILLYVIHFACWEIYRSLNLWSLWPFQKTARNKTYLLNMISFQNILSNIKDRNRTFLKVYFNHIQHKPMDSLQHIYTDRNYKHHQSSHLSVSYGPLSSLP